MSQSTKQLGNVNTYNSVESQSDKLNETKALLEKNLYECSESDSHFERNETIADLKPKFLSLMTKQVKNMILYKELTHASC